MAGLLMPKVKSTVPVVSARGPRATGYAGKLISQAGTRLGRTISEIGRRKTDEYDVSTATTQYNDFRQTAREQFIASLSLRGSEARGGSASYSDWYRKESGKVLSELGSDRQKAIFSNLSTGRYNADMDTLSRHEASEHFAELGATATATKINSVNEAITNPSADLNPLIEKGIEDINNAKPGRDNSEEIDRFRSSVYQSAITSIMKTDPRKALEQIEKPSWKAGLGQRYNDLHEGVKLEALYAEAKEANPGDFKAQKAFIKAADIREPTRRVIRGRIKSDEAEQKGRERVEKQEQRLNSQNAYWSALGSNNMSGARKIAEGLDVKGGTFTEQERQGMLARTQSTVAVSDPNNWRQMRWDILTGKIKTESEVWSDERAASIDNAGLMQLEKLLSSESSDSSRYSEALSDVEWSFKSLYKDDDNVALKFLAFQREILTLIDIEEGIVGRKLTHGEIMKLAEGELTPRVRKRAILPDKKIDSPFEKSLKVEARDPVVRRFSIPSEGYSRPRDSLPGETGKGADGISSVQHNEDLNDPANIR